MERSNRGIDMPHKNKEKIREYNREWYKKNKEKIREHNQKNKEKNK